MSSSSSATRQRKRRTLTGGRHVVLSCSRGDEGQCDHRCQCGAPDAAARHKLLHIRQACTSSSVCLGANDSFSRWRSSFSVDACAQLINWAEAAKSRGCSVSGGLGHITLSCRHHACAPRQAGHLWATLLCRRCSAGAVQRKAVECKPKDKLYKKVSCRLQQFWDCCCVTYMRSTPARIEVLQRPRCAAIDSECPRPDSEAWLGAKGAHIAGCTPMAATPDCSETKDLLPCPR